MLLTSFSSDNYRRHNQRRQEHLSSLHLPLAKREVLEVGAGIGDHTEFFLDRGCAVTATDARRECLDVLVQRFQGIRTVRYDANDPAPAELKPHEVVYAYGVIYHLREPERAIDNLAKLCTDLFLLETCVELGDSDEVRFVKEDITDPTQAVGGLGCRPTRLWVWNRLRARFPHVYVPWTQPAHEQFPLDWAASGLDRLPLVRAIFVASHEAIKSRLLSSDLLRRHVLNGAEQSLIDRSSEL